MNTKNDDQCLDFKPIKKLTDASLKNLIHKKYKLDQLETMKPENKIIKKIYQDTGVSIRQLGRVLGIG